uniref:BRCT domain-containing protein n=1 Tax=Angiostrongylus cantonensis TaxID=6313 RepID=A0A158P6N0_ANGCA
MQTPTVIPSEDYFKSLNIPPIRFDFNEDQLRIHVICAMLCCPRQMDDGGNISGESVDRNFREISGGCLDSNIIACAVTKDDAVEAEEFAKNPVPWQVIQKRYQNMVTKAGSRDEDLMDKYRRYGLDFTDPVLNSEVVKKLTGQKKITKGLNQAVFYGIHCDNSSSLLMVGINENARPYSEEELIRAAKVCEASTSIPAFLSDVTSLYQNTSRSPLFNVMSGGRKLNKRKKWEENNSRKAYRSDINESPHIALFSSEDDCDSESGSEEPRNEIGVYTTDEENDLVVACLPLYPELSFCNRRHQQSGAIHVVVARRRRAKQCGEPLPPIPKLALKPTTFTWLDFCNRRHEQSGAIYVVVARRHRAKQCGEPLPPIPKLALKPTTFTWLDFCNRRHEQSGAIYVVVARRRRAKQCGEPLPPIPKLALKPTTFTRLEFVASETKGAHSAPLEASFENKHSLKNGDHRRFNPNKLVQIPPPGNQS